MSQVSPLIELHFRVQENRKSQFSKEDIANMIRELLPYEEQCFDDISESEGLTYRGMFNTNL